jgi:hypothetical protein
MFFCSKFNGNFVAVNSTISDNRTLGSNGAGGGIFVARRDFGGELIEAYLRNLTVTQNVSAAGGGVGVKDLDNMRVRMANSIISENFDGPETDPNRAPNNLVGRVIVSEFKHNLVGTGSSILDNANGNPAVLDPANMNLPNNDAPHLSPLGDNGGFTPTHILLAESPAIDAGSNDLAKTPLTGDPGDPNDDDPLETDQRGSGFTRIVDLPGYHDPGAIVDMGAYEADAICLYVTTTDDEIDSVVNFDDFSLREAVDYANTAGVPITICLPTGEYFLVLSGSQGVEHGDLDITGDVTITGDGPGLSIVNAGTLSTDDRIFDIANGGTLNLSGVTLTLGDAPNNPSTERNGGAIRIQNGGELNLDFSAIVGNITGHLGRGGGIYFDATGKGSIANSVITVNEGDNDTGGLYLRDASSPDPTKKVTLANTIIANNVGDPFPDIYVGANRTLDSLGGNRFPLGTTGVTGNPSVADYYGSVDYIVTSVADVYDGDSDPVNMSLRDAIHRANITAGTQEIWLPAWDFILTRERTAALNETEMDVSQGDLEVTDSLVIRGITNATTVAWQPGLPEDKTFELLGDYNNDGFVDLADSVEYYKLLGYSGSNLPADGNDDGVVDEEDYDVWSDHFGTTLLLLDVA